MSCRVKLGRLRLLPRLCKANAFHLCTCYLHWGPHRSEVGKMLFRTAWKLP